MNNLSDTSRSTKSIIKSATDMVFVAIAFVVIVGASYMIKFGGPWSRVDGGAMHTTVSTTADTTADKNQVIQARAEVQRAAILEERRASQAVWGQLGDYMGGVLNPLLSFFALYLLMRNLQLQQVQIAQTEKSIAAVSVANEISALASALDVISEDVRQMQATQGFSDSHAYRKAVELKVWLAREIANRATNLGTHSVNQNTK